MSLLTAEAFAGPRDEVLRVVPDGAGFCIVVTDLRGTLDRIQRSPFARRFLNSPVGQGLLKFSKNQALDDLDRHLRAGFQTSLAEFRDEIAGDAFALAFLPGPDGKPENDGGLFALHARNPKLLSRLFDRLNDLQKQSGELSSVEHREYRGVGYWARRKKAGGDEFAAVIGPLFVLADREITLRAAIERAAGTAPARLAERLTRLGVDRDPFVWWFNPRAFDAALKHKASVAEGAEGEFLRTFVRHWAAIDEAAIHVHVDRDIALSMTIASAERFRDRSAVQSAALAGFPADALFVAGGRFSFDALAQSAGEFLSPEARAELKSGLDRSLGAVLGRDAAGALAAAVGPDWGLCVATPAAAELLPTVTVVVKVRDEGDPPAPRRALDGLDFAARLAALAYNGQHKGRLEIRTEKQGDIQVRVIDGDPALPPGFRPAFAWKRGYIVIASSPEAVRRFAPPDGDEVAGAAEVILARIAARNVAAYLSPRRDALAAFTAQANGETPAAVRARIDGLLAVLGWFDAVELTQRAEPDRATLTLRIKPAESLAAGAEKNPTALPASRSNSGAGTEKRP